MASLLLLIPLGIVLLGVSIWAFFWAADHGQFDDLDTPATRILDEHPPVQGSGSRAAAPDKEEKA